MATIEDFDFKSISDMSQDEAIEHLRQIRLSRRTPKKKVHTSKKARSKEVPNISTDQAKRLLALLGE